jgi:uncharacterized protein with HEPN domain
MKREVGDYIEDIISAMGKAMDLVKNISYEEFIQEDKTVFAVVRALEIIGEAAKKNITAHSSEEYKAKKKAQTGYGKIGREALYDES